MLAAAKRLWFGVRCSHSRQPGASGIQFFNHGIFFRCQTAPWKYSYMLGGMVFTSNDDPRKYGLVASLNRPGGNVTGVSWFRAELGPKRLALLHDLLPNAMTVAVLRNPNNAEQADQPAELQKAARTLGLQLLVLNVTTPNEIDTAFATVVQERIGALIVAGDSFLWNRR